MSFRVICPVIIATALASACSATGSSEASASSQQSAWQGTDQVGTVTPAMLLGSWQSRPLNAKVSAADRVRITYKPDGTYVGTSDTSGAGSPMKLLIRGTWAIEGEMVRQEISEMKETSGNPIAALAMPLVQSLITRRGSTANVYEATHERVVLVWTDGMAQELVPAQ